MSPVLRKKAEFVTNGDNPLLSTCLTHSDFVFGHVPSSCPMSDSDEDPSMGVPKRLGSDALDEGEEDEESGEVPCVLRFA